MENNKWHMPGWRVVQKFSPGVLIGNWDQEQYRYQRNNLPHNSTQRIDFKDYGSYKPDKQLQHKLALHNEGLSKEHMFDHHGKAYSDNMITSTYEHYNLRERLNKLPDQRIWDSQTGALEPEIIDHPLAGNPKRFGLYDRLKAIRTVNLAEDARGEYVSTYESSYMPHGSGALTATRFATPAAESSSLHRFNSINKNLHLRNGNGGGGAMLQAPELLPGITATLTGASQGRRSSEAERNCGV